MAVAITILNTEPGANCAWIARFSRGVCLSLFSACHSSLGTLTEKSLGSKVGRLTIARISPVRGSLAECAAASPAKTREALTILRSLRVPFVIHQPSYSLLNRWVENGLLELLQREGIGCIAFSPLAQGLLSARYLQGIPETSRAAQGGSFGRSMLSESNLERVRALNEIARERGQSLAQMAIAWVLKTPVITSALVGASSWPQIEESLGALRNVTFTQAELDRIDAHARDGGLNIWAASSQSG